MRRHRHLKCEAEAPVLAAAEEMGKWKRAAAWRKESSRRPLIFRDLRENVVMRMLEEASTKEGVFGWGERDLLAWNEATMVW